MFSKVITESGRFLKMPPSSQALYFQLGMNADDDGVVEAFKVMKLTNSNDDDLKVLVSKNLIKILNEDLVSFVMDWSEHNLIRADRKIDSIYKDLLLKMVDEVDILEAKPRADTKKLTGGQPLDVQMSAQDKISKDKISKDKEREESPRETSSRFFSEEDNQEQESVILMLIENGMSENIARAEIKKFISYWNELNSTGKKHRWEMEKTFEIKRRLTTWFAKASQFSGFDKKTNKIVIT